ncbi:MAG: hypothetical protein U1C55_04930 [Smithellaceae bacterium]|nr:hypothetical protein [Smithellaceae bacterium]
MNENDFEKIDGMIARHVGAFADSIQHKLDIVVEGHQLLSEKIDRVETRLDKRMDCLEHKLDAVAAETNENTLAIRDLTHKVDALTTQTSAHTVAIQDLTHKVDVVAADLSAHRADTEAHPPVYRVKE